MILRSPIAIDLGAKNTGLVYTTYQPNTTPSEIHGATIISDNLQLSQVERRSKRHQRRNYTRMRLARRLVYLIVRSHYEIPEEDLTSEVKTSLQSLLTRRGYTFQSIETESNEIGQIAWGEIEEYFPKIQGPEKSLPIQAVLDHFFSSENLELSKLEPTKAGETKEEKDILKFIKEQKEKFETEQRNGARHRTKYFEEITEDFKRKTKLVECLKKHKIEEQRFLNLIQNISNLQIKLLRAYFNDKKMKEKEIWDPARLHIHIARWIRAWHVDPKDSEKQASRRNLLSLLENGKLRIIKNNSTYSPSLHIISFLEEVDPKDTIPPYEDQNNRRPPKCQNLWLDSKILDKYFPGWDHSLWKLIKKEENGPFGQLLTSNFQVSETSEGISLTKLVQNYNRAHSNQKLDVRAVILQRFLDRSAKLDPWSLRLQGKAKKEIEIFGSLSKTDLQKAAEAYEKTKEVLGESDANQFLKLADRYYLEVADIKKGMWTPPDPERRHKEIPKSIAHEENEDISLFHKCDTKTGSKQKNLSNLVGNILNVKFSLDSFQNFLSLWTEKFDGRSSLNSLAKSIEETRSSQNEFVIEYSIFLKKIKKREQIDKKDEIYKVYQNTIKSSERLEQLLKEKLGFQNASKSYFGNPYSIAQLYNLISVDRAGFSKVCKSCQEENHWRSTLIDTDRGHQAWASKQVADTGRLFDGQLAMLLDRLALEIFKLKKAEIVKYISDNKLLKIDKVEIPLLIEENSFNFRYELAELKALSKKKKDQLKKSVEDFETRLNSKQDRIKAASRELCPYTGKKISKGEIDHILPRSLTQKQFGTVFNAEANLIYASREGNQSKGSREYGLNDLDDKYLNKIFGTKDIGLIQKIISETIDRLDIESSTTRIVFDRLSPNEQDCLRHALFIKSLRSKVFELLSGQLKARVNGTQLYLAKSIRNLFRENQDFTTRSLTIKVPSFSFYEPRAVDLPYMRRELAEKFPNLGKQNPQPTGSHIVDAAMVLAYAVETDSGNLSFGSKDKSEGFDSESLSRFLPSNIQFLSIKSKDKTDSKYPYKKPLFKDGVFGERFLPILITGKGIRIGYTLENSLEINSGNSEEFFNVLKPFLLFKRKPIENNYQTLVAFAQKDKRGYIVLPVNKPKALESISLRLKDSHTSILKSISYAVSRESISGFLFDKNTLLPEIKSNKVNWGDKLEKEFKIKVEVRLNSKKITSGFIQYPGKLEWEKLLLSEPLHGLIKNRSLTPKWFDDLENLSQLDDHFKDTSNPETKHKRKSNHYALAVPKGPSGGFRVKRNSFDGYKVYQLYSVNGNSFHAFKIENGEIGKTLLLDVYQNSSSLDSLDYDYENTDISKIAPFSKFCKIEFSEEETQKIKSKGVNSLYVAPGSSSRQYIRMEIDKSAFSKFTKFQSKFWQFDLTTPLHKDKAKDLMESILKVFPEELRPKKPRNDIHIQNVSHDSVQVEYIADGKTQGFGQYFINQN